LKAGAAGPARRWEKVEELFAAAAELPPGERSPFLAEACAGDGPLCAEVEALLAADDRAGELDDLLEGAVRAGWRSLTDGAQGFPWVVEGGLAGGRIGPYRLERELGRGGMGTVYLAVRDDELRRRVALKVLRRGLDTDDVLRRFRTERQILADLDHPSIARLYDGGTTADGRPYFVLELVEGEALDAWCDRRRLTVPQRLRLFLQVCSAVAHAHGRLVVHRDLKPGNVLVTGEGEVKLLDFGIAKLLEPEGGEGITTLGSFQPLTPGYASPEQLRGEPVSTASDVYSLGVLLYELLAGRRPERPAGREPEPPSAAAARVEERTDGRGRRDLLLPEEVARARGATARELRRRLRGDLDAVVLAALREDPARRYGSVEQLAEDVRRHLEARPVRARRDTFGYRAAKFLRRNRLPAAAALAFTLLLVAFAASTARQSARTERERDKAEQALAFLVDLFEVSDPAGRRARR
jgi:eukaryotic-like serine/threonine-protein kinase